LASAPVLAYNRGVFLIFLIAEFFAATMMLGLVIGRFVETTLGYLSGWTVLGRRFKAASTPARWDWVAQTIKVGTVRYRRCLRLSAEPEGLYICEASLMRAVPLYIPWGEIHQARPALLDGKNAVAVTVGTPPVATLEFPAVLYRSIQATVQQRWGGTLS